MASILPGYQYDIFISYRQKDNRSDQWVTNFVQALREELDATFKEEVSIYFDSNPHYGLLETHDVDGSLKEKIKCLVFIPIVSQTYCDPKSFAWQKEFLAFLDFVKQDEVGLDIKLPNGNVAKRVLPVRIHEIDNTDKKLFEDSISGVLRPIDFIYKSAGVNRPLRSNEDNPSFNLNQTFYRDQINKVANAIKEIISALQKDESDDEEPGSYRHMRQEAYKSKGKKLWPLMVTFLVVVSIFFFLLFNRTTNAKVISDKSIAVLPFENLSDEPEQDYFSNGVTEEILTHLFKIGDLRITSRTSVMGYKGTTKNMNQIGKELNVSHILEGSVQKYGNKVRINVQLIDASNDNHLWAERYDRELKDIFSIQSEVAFQIAKALKANLSPELTKRLASNPTTNTEAYDLFLKGREQISLYYSTFEPTYIDNGIHYFNEAVKLDSNYSYAYTGLARANWVRGQFSPEAGVKFWRDAKTFALKAIQLDPNNGLAYAELSEVQYKWEWDKSAALESLEKAISLAPGDLDIRDDAVYFFQRTNNCQRLESESNVMNSISNNKYPITKYFIPLCRNDIEQIKLLEATQYGNHAASILNQQEKYRECIQLLTEQAKSAENSFTVNGILGEACALSGDLKMADKIVNELNIQSKQGYVSKTSMAAVFMAMGQNEKAFELLEQALDENDPYLHVMMEFHVSICRNRDDPRMVSIIERSWIPSKL